MPPAPLDDLLRESISRPNYKPLRPKALAKHLGLKKQKMADFFERLDGWEKSGLIARTESGRIIPGRTLARAGALGGKQISGTLKRTAAGDGFVLPHGVSREQPNAEIFIDSSALRDAQTGDTVLIELLNARRGGGRRMGRIVEVLERASTTFVGSYFEEDDQGWVQIDGKNFPEPVWVGDPGAKGATSGDKVVVDMVRFPTSHRRGEAVVTRVLGPRGEPGVDLLTILNEFNIPDEFPVEVLEEARAAAQTVDEESFGDREDLTKQTIITIDPVDARDFDDAISLERTKQGHWLLGVHIADVSFFVTPGSELDREAYRRGNSVYLPRHVIPMLPEVLSNSLASLQANQVRYTLSAFIEFSAEGVAVHSRFARTAIRVVQRFAYEEVMPIVRAPQRAKEIAPAVRTLLCDMYELAMLLRKRRQAKGALELEMSDIELDLDADGRVVGAHEEHHDESHEIIEEFMLAANIAVATSLDDQGEDFLRRVHDDPSLTKMQAFAQFAGSVGYPVHQPQSRRELQGVLAKSRNAPESRAINYALLRSLKQAIYSPEKVGHYALAEEQYCHFTSPIRRYPDLLIHRLLIAQITGNRTYRGPRGAELVQAGMHCSETERRAESAERELTRIKLLEYLQTRVGEELDAVVTGVDRFGFFCRGISLPAEGLVHISTLRDDIYDYDRGGHCLVARRSGATIRLGDAVRVSIARVDVDRRELDLRLADRGKSSGEVPHGDRRPKKSREAGTSGKDRQKPNKGSGASGAKRKRRPGPAKRKRDS